MLPTDMDDNTLMVLDFGDSFYAFVHGVAAGGCLEHGAPAHLRDRRRHQRVGDQRQTHRYAGMDLDAEYGMNGSLPHVTGAHRTMEESRPEDVMQLVDWVIDDTPTIITRNTRTWSRSSTCHARRLYRRSQAAPF